MGDNWELPKPVFRSSSGSLPQDFPARVGVEEQPQVEVKTPDEGEQILSSLYARPEEKSEDVLTADPPEPSPAIVDIEPQPLISEQFTVDEIDSPAFAKPAKNGGSGFAMLLIGVTVLIAVVGGILSIVYCLFVRNPPDPTY